MKEIFDEILTTFENEDLKDFFVNKCIPTIPDYWYHAPASSSGMFHSPISLGDGGLMRHTLALVRVLNYMFEVEIVKNQYTSRERDLLRIAGLFHDSRKSGSQEEYDENKQTKFDHPLKAAWVINSLDGISDDEKKLICRVISRHMGVFNTSKRMPDVVLPIPQDKYDAIVHLCDYIVSRKDIEMKFDPKYMGEPEVLPDINEYKFDFGKHSGQTIPEVAALDPGYIRWAKENMTREPARSLLKDFAL